MGCKQFACSGNVTKVAINNIQGVNYIFEFNEDFIKRYNDESDEGYFLEIDIQYPDQLHYFHGGLTFLPERMEIEKIKKLVFNFHDKNDIIKHDKTDW